MLMHTIGDIKIFALPNGLIRLEDDFFREVTVTEKQIETAMQEMFDRFKDDE